MLPNFLLIGPGRSGTDWVTKNLQLHPDIFIPERKSTRFFTDNFEHGIPWYEQHFQKRRETAIGEASVGYLTRNEAPERISKVIPNVKLIATLRNPVDRAFSSFGRLSGLAAPGQKNFGITFERKIEESPELLQAGMYATHLRRYFSFFGRDQLLVLIFDDMITDPQGYLNAIYRFLDVDEQFQSPLLDQRLNSTATYRTNSKFLFQVYRAALKFNLFSVSRRMENAIRVNSPKLEQSTRQRLIEQVFMKDIEDLESLVDRDLSAWKRS